MPQVPCVVETCSRTRSWPENSSMDGWFGIYTYDGEREISGHVCPEHSGPLLTFIRLPIREEALVPQENVTEHVKCSAKGCKSIFWRPQEADGALQTVDIAQMHGWKVVDREKGLVHCAWGHEG